MSLSAPRRNAEVRDCQLLHGRRNNRTPSRAGPRDAARQSRFAPASYQRLSTSRSASVICVALFKGIALSTTACW